MESPIILQTNRLKLYYGAFEALKGIDMQIPEKQITAFIGPSGCGKSTFLKTLNRMNDLVPGVRIEGAKQGRINCAKNRKPGKYRKYT